MGLSSARRVITGCAISTAAVAALFAPGSAMAVTKQCSGTATKGAGSSAQKLAQQEVWGSEAAIKGKGFNVSANADACNGTQQSKGKPVVNYESIGSGAGLEKWGVNKHAFELSTFGFIGTDEPVNEAQKTEIEENQLVKTPETVQTIPVVQFAVAVPIHLPAGCTATSTPTPGRLVLNNKTLEEIFRGVITKWSQIKDSGDKLEGGACNAETEITRVVRLDQSGTTHVFKKYLGLINKAGKWESEKGGEKTWDEVSEGTENTTWPAAAKVVRPTGTGGGKVVAKVAETASSIGYANLADVRSNGSFSKTGVGGPSTATFWPEIENNGTVTTKPLYADPSTNEDAEAVANSKCVKEKYTNGTGTKFPPVSTAKSWSEVTTETKQAVGTYPLCGVTYDMGMSKFSVYPGSSEGESQTVADYLQFVEDTGVNGGQPTIQGHDYEKLPSTLNDISQDGADELKF